MSENEEEHLILESQSLIVFVDETGHEDLDDPNHPVFGLGGCAILGAEYERMLYKPWLQLKRQMDVGLATPLHAATTPLTKRQIALIGNFFRVSSFARIGTGINAKAIVSEGIDIHDLVCKALVNRFLAILSYSSASSMTFVFESSQRTNPLVERHFQGVQIAEDGRKNIPWKGYFLDKSSCEPGLEVADFITHALGGQVRRELQGTKGYRQDFEAVFQSVPREIASYLHITQALLHESETDCYESLIRY